LFSIFFRKVNKQVGQTPFQLLQLLQNSTNQKYFHTGNLDPMASGLMLYVSAKFRFLEKKLKSLTKVYEFTIIQGFNTDSNDLLGLITDYDVNNKTIDFSKKINSLPRNYITQRPPKISRKNLKKSKISAFLNNEKLDNLPFRPVKIYYLKYLGQSTILKEDLYTYVTKSFKLLPGDFRQEKIIDLYQSNLANFPHSFNLYKFKIKVSGGFYVRSFVRDVSEKLNKPLTTFRINRTKMGLIKL